MMHSLYLMPQVLSITTCSPKSWKYWTLERQLALARFPVISPQGFQLMQKIKSVIQKSWKKHVMTYDIVYLLFLNYKSLSVQCETSIYINCLIVVFWIKSCRRVLCKACYIGLIDSLVPVLTAGDKGNPIVSCKRIKTKSMCRFRWWRRWVWGRSGSLACSTQTVKATSHGSSSTRRWEIRNTTTQGPLLFNNFIPVFIICAFADKSIPTTWKHDIKVLKACKQS